jgi:hypothetical protein
MIMIYDRNLLFVKQSMKRFQKLKYGTQPGTGITCSVFGLHYMNQNRDQKSFSHILYI